MKYAVETQIGNGWENVWMTGDDKPILFDTYEEAEYELRDHLKDYQEAFDEGFVSSVPEPDEFRIVEVEDK